MTSWKSLALLTIFLILVQVFDWVIHLVTTGFEWRLIASFVVLLNSAFCHLQLLNGPSAGLLSQPFAIGAIALASAAIFLVINLAWLGVHGFAGRVVVYVLIATDLVVVGCQAYMLAHTFAAAKRAQADSELGRS